MAPARPGESPTLDSLKTSWSLVARQQVDRLRHLRPQALHHQRRRQGPERAGVLQLRRHIGPAWSPDGKLIAYSKTDVSRSSDIYLIPTAGGEEKKITFDSLNESNPRFSADGTKVYFIRRDGDLGRRHAADSADLLRAAREAHR